MGTVVLKRVVSVFGPDDGEGPHRCKTQSNNIAVFVWVAADTVRLACRNGVGVTQCRAVSRPRATPCEEALRPTT
jgi:hypothetical protein